MPSILPYGRNGPMLKDMLVVPSQMKTVKKTNQPSPESHNVQREANKFEGN